MTLIIEKLIKTIMVDYKTLCTPFKQYTTRKHDLKEDILIFIYYTKTSASFIKILSVGSNKKDS